MISTARRTNSVCWLLGCWISWRTKIYLNWDKRNNDIPDFDNREIKNPLRHVIKGNIPRNHRGQVNRPERVNQGTCPCAPTYSIIDWRWVLLIPTYIRKKRGESYRSLAPHSEALALAHPVKNEQRTETHVDDYMIFPYGNLCDIHICHIRRRIGNL